MSHFAHTMLPLQFCYQFYACLILLSFFGAISILVIALMTLYGVGGVELVFTISFVIFHALLRLFMPPWTSSSSSSPRSSASSSNLFGKDSEHSSKPLALDKYIYNEDEQQPNEDKEVAAVAAVENKMAMTTTEEGVAAAKAAGEEIPKQQNSLQLRSDSCCCKLQKKKSPCCAICLHTLKNGDDMSMGRVCGHSFHTECLKPWLLKSTTCPYCRQDLRDRTKLKSSDIHKSVAWGIFDGIFDSMYA